MKVVALVAAWIFIFAVTFLDVGFAYVHRDSMEFWEANPMMQAAVKVYGPLPVIGFRLLTVVFGAMVISISRWCVPATGVVAVIHAALLMVYVYAALVQW